MKKNYLTLGISVVGFVFCFLLLTNEQQPLTRSEEEGHALEAFEFWYNQRALPFDKIPNGAYLRAAEYVKTKMISEKNMKTAFADTTQWHSIGPDNVGGRVLAIAINPSSTNVIWVGAASGGLWKSTTAGVGASAWTQVLTGYPTVAVSSISIDSTNTNTMYIGTGEVGSAYGRGQVGTPGARSSYGLGVLKSTDGGSSWSLTGLTYTFPQVTAIQKVLLNPRNTNTIYAATTEGTLKSTDAGSTWTLVHSVLMAMDIVINPNDTSVLYASYGQRGSTTNPGIYKTTNAGTSWTLLAGGLPASNFGRTSLSISLTNPQVVYASISKAAGPSPTYGLLGLYKTTDGGSSWSLKSTTNYLSGQGWYDNVIAVHPLSAETLYCAGLDIYKSVNGGTTLSQRSYWYLGYDNVVPAGGPEGPSNYAHADHHSITFDPTNSNIIYHGCDGGVFASTDGGTTFEGRNGGFITTQFYNGFANAETDSAIALGGLQDNGTVKYEGNLSWNKTYGGDGGWCAIDPTNKNILYEEYVYLALSKSTDGGVNWFGITSGLGASSSNTNFIAPFVICPSNSNDLYGGTNLVNKTTDGGQNWFATNSGVSFNGTNVASIGVSYKNSDILIAGTGSSATGATFRIYASTNGGTSWSMSDTTGLPNRYPTDISFDPNSNLIAYLSFSGYGTPHVFKTTNSGLTWTNISSNLPDIPTQSIAVDPLVPTNVYVGTDLGVYRTVDGGTSWQVFDNGMPPAMVLDVSISSVNRSLRAATFGNGVYERGLTAPNVMDYRALAFISPSNGSELLKDSAITSITASFSNVGAIVSSDSFDVKYEILQGVTPLYSNSKRISSLSSAEIRSVTFDGSFTPIDTGTYTLRAILLTADANAANDTATGTLKIVIPGSIAYIHVEKQYCPYTEIAGGAAGPTGDDAQTSVVLPFSFVFDNYTYDSIQISTNGWAEFGTGTNGSLRGLSNPGQIGLGNANGTLFTPSRPNKLLGVWLEDLNTDVTGSVTYKTLGIAPGREFVIQWKSILAYYDPGTTTTRINFQIRLYETSNIVEYQYGPVQAGTLGGSDVGAMIGMKDHLGGNYHFYDIALGGTGTVTQGITNLTPLANWPGQDSCYRIGEAIVTTSVSLDAKWNLVSVPLTRSDNSVASIFPTAIIGSMYGYNNGYELKDSLVRGKGFWAKFPSATSQSISGTALSSVSVAVGIGWNLIGSVDHSATAPSGGIITSAVYGFSNGYNVATTIEPGKGYWMKTSAAGTISLGPAAAPRASVVGMDAFSSITMTDRLGRKQILYLADNSDNKLNLDLFEMPPAPPTGIFDARFATQRMVEGYSSDERDRAFPLLFQSVEFPMYVSADLNHQSRTRLLLEERDGNKVVATRELIDGKAVIIDELRGTTLALRVIAASSIPKEFALNQNYPNPFNPSTTIRFDLPQDVHVSLVIYDVAGREVGTLVEADYPAGSHSIDANLLSLASGMYFYRLTVTSSSSAPGQKFSQTRKMVLVK